MNSMQVLRLTLLLLVSFCHATPLEERFTGPSDPRRITLITLPEKGAGPCDISTGPDGETLWFRDLKANAIGYYNVQTKKVAEFTIPDAKSANSSSLYRCWVRTGADGNIYSGAPGITSVIKINPKTNAIKVYDDAVTDPYEASSSDTGLYITNFEQNTVTFYNYKTGEFTTTTLPTQGSGPTGINAISADITFLSQAESQQIGRIDSATGSIDEYSIPLPNAAAFPGLMRAFTQGKYLWVISLEGSSLIRVDTATNPIGLKIISGGTGDDTIYYQDEADPLGRVWLTIPAQNLLLYYTPSKASYTTITIPGQTGGTGSADRALPIHYGPANSMWFTDVATGQLGQYKL